MLKLPHFLKRFEFLRRPLAYLAPQCISLCKKPPLEYSDKVLYDTHVHLKEKADKRSHLTKCAGGFFKRITHCSFTGRVMHKKL
jgi:hypothetical protein